MRVFLAAGEPSGDRLGAALMAGLRQLVPGVEFAGVGGPAMAAEGVESVMDLVGTLRPPAVATCGHDAPAGLGAPGHEPALTHEQH